MILIVEYPTLKFSRMAAGIINTSMIQLQLLLNQPLFNEIFRMSTSTMESNPQGNNRKVEVVLVGTVAIMLILYQKDTRFGGS